MENISLQGLNLNIFSYKFNLNNIDFIILNKDLLVYCSNGKILNLEVQNKENVFTQISRLFYEGGIEQFVTLKGKRIFNVEKLKDVLVGSNGIIVRTDNHNVKMSDLNENHAKMLANMYFNSTFITDYELTK